MSKSEKIITDLVNLFHNDFIDPHEFQTAILNYKTKKKNTSTIWHPQHEIILKHISEKCDWYNELHTYTGEEYNNLGNCIYIPLIVSTLSVGLFTLIANNYDNIIITFYFWWVWWYHHFFYYGYWWWGWDFNIRDRVHLYI